jgi:hypothetical protein
MSNEILIKINETNKDNEDIKDLNLGELKIEDIISIHIDNNGITGHLLTEDEKKEIKNKKIYENLNDVEKKAKEIQQSGGKKKKKKRKKKKRKKTKKNRKKRKNKTKRRSSQKGCGGTSSKPVVKQCADDAACTPEEQVRMFESDKRHSDFIRIINLGISISDEIPKAESLRKPTSKTIFSKGPITEIKNKFLGFGVQLKPTQHLLGDQTDRENAEKGQEKYGNNDGDEYMTLTGSPSGNEEEIKKIQAKIEEENKKLADYAISLKQLDATQVILKEKGLKEILLDVFNKPNKIPLDEVKRIIDNYFDGLKKELEEPLYDTLMKLKSGISTDAIQRMKNLGISIDNDNIKTFTEIEKDHKDLLLKYFGDSELYKALFDVDKDEVVSFDFTEQFARGHKGGKKNRKKSTKKKHKKKRGRTMKKSRKKRGGMNNRFIELQDELSKVDNGQFLDETMQADYNIMMKKAADISKEWSNVEEHGLLNYTESRKAVKLIDKEIQINKLLTKYSIISPEILRINLNQKNVKMMEQDPLEAKKYMIEGVSLEESLTQYNKLLITMAEEILKQKTKLSNELREPDNKKIVDAIRNRKTSTDLIGGITKFQAAVRDYFDKKYTELSKIAMEHGETLPMEKSELIAYEPFLYLNSAP